MPQHSSPGPPGAPSLGSAQGQLPVLSCSCTSAPGRAEATGEAASLCRSLGGQMPPEPLGDPAREELGLQSTQQSPTRRD